DATTRTRSVAIAGRDVTPLLAPDEVVTSPETRLSYRVGRLLGAGGFGQVYHVTRIGPSTVVPESLCLKVSTRIDGWLREADLRQILADHPRAIRVFDTFPSLREGQLRARPLYCLALEYARHGDLSMFLRRTGKGWPERLARREIAGILEVLGKLHRGQ